MPNAPAALFDLDTPYDAVDLFAGPGGWDVAAQRLGLKVLGFEFDPHACDTRDAAGHHTVRGDLTALNPRDHLARGQIGSPPCQGFSMAGSGKGRADSLLILDRLDSVRTRSDLLDALDDLHEHMTDDKSLLALQPLLWALTNTPSWIAWEQVPPVLPLWEACAAVLRRIGYSVATGVLNAEQYGVPQTRRRAILVARAPWLVAELGPVELPQPTHSRYHNRSPERVDDGLPRWISMAEALGWGMTDRTSYTVTGGGAATGGAEPFGRGARDGLYREQDAGRWEQRSNYNHADTGDRTRRDLAEPSTTITGRPPQWAEPVQMMSGTRPKSAVRGEEQPAPTIAPGHDSASYVWAPEGMTPEESVAWKAEHTEGPRSSGVRVTPQEAAVLQTFPPNYPWQGNKGQVYQQIGNAVPPLLAEAVLAAVIGVPFEPPLRG